MIVLDAVSQRRGCDAKMFSQSSESSSLTTIRHQPVIPLVGTLLYTGCPPAIFGAVRPVVVDAFNALVGWLLSHIGKEVGKRLPPFADRDAAPAVVRVGFAGTVLASLPHGVPYAVGVGARLAMSLVCPNKFALPAPAASGVAAGQVSGANNDFLTAGADAMPVDDRSAADSACVVGARDCGQPPKVLAGDVVCVSHATLYNGIKYDVA